VETCLKQGNFNPECNDSWE